MDDVLGQGAQRGLGCRRDHDGMTKGPGRILRAVLHAQRVLYRHRLGWLLGHRFLLLEHIRRISGRQYQTVLEVVEYDGSSGEAVVMSGWGTSSDWYRNVEAAGQARITLGRQTVGAITRVLGDWEAAEVLACYEKRNRWVRPLVHRVLSRLAGFQYDGTEQSRLALVQKLPLVKFTPSPSGMSTS